MLNYQVERSIQIDKPAESVLTFLSDFQHWPVWSPWLIQEPDCPITYLGTQGQVGCGYQWDGNMVGAGEMQLKAMDANRLDMALSFLKPFKSQAQVSFIAKPNATGCTLTWTMASKVPWFLFFLKGMFKSWIAMDYQRGLIMLKSKLECGLVNSRCDILGRQPWKQTKYVGIKGKATIPELGPVMQEHFTRLNEYLASEGLVAAGSPFALYDAMNMKTMEFTFTSCVPVGTIREQALPDGLMVGELPEADSFAVRHTGEYPFLGNAWATVMTAARYQKVKVKRKPMGLELYQNDPAVTPAEELVTDVVLFCR